MSQDDRRIPGDTVVIDWDALHYVTPVPQSLFCPVCKNVLLLPLHTSCKFAHTLCCRCITRSLQDRLECPVDRTPMPRGLQDCSPVPNILTLVLEDLEVRCPNVQCTQTLYRGSLEQHLRIQCPWQSIDCVDRSCSALVPRCQYNAENCTHLVTKCEHCHENIMSRDSQAHLDECTELSQECAHCKEEFSVEELTEHRVTCSMCPTSCTARELGCLWTGTRGGLVQHLENCSINMMAPWLLSQADELSSVKLENTILKQKLETLSHLHAEESIIEVSSEYERDRTYLFETLETLSSGLENLSTSLAALDTRQNHFVISETMRTKDEIAMLRGGLQALRLQWHHFVQNTRGPLATYRAVDRQGSFSSDPSTESRASKSRSSSNESTRVKL